MIANTVADRPLILIVAADLPLVQTLRALLPSDGVATATASSGAEALDMAQRLHPHLILLDADLPVGDGVQVCARLLALPGSARTPVMMFSDDPQVEDRTFDAGAIDFVAKPVQTHWAGPKRRIQYLLRTRQAEEALEQERTQWRTLVDNLPDYIYVKDSQSRFVNANDALALSVGLTTPADVIGKSDLDFHPPELAAQYLADEQALMESGQPLINHEEPVLDRQTGKMAWYWSTKIPMKDAQGSIVGLVGVGRNITEHKAQEERREQERVLLRTLLDNVPDYIFAKDAAGRFVISNIAHARAANVAPDELVGKTAFDVFPPHLAAQFDADDKAIMQSGKALISAERRTVDPNGAERTVLSTKVPLRNDQGKVIGLVGISRDITEHRLAEKALAEERALLRTLLDNLPDNIFIKDAQGRIVIDNAAHRQLLGFASLEEAVGKRDVDCFGPELASQYFADEQAVIRSGQPIYNREEPTVDRAGNQKWLLTTKLPLRTSRGEISGIIGINRDITERKQAEERLLEERGLLRTLIDALPDYIYVKDRQGRFLINNLAQVAILGAARLEETIGKTDFDFFTPDEATRYFADEQTVIQSDHPLLHREEPGVDRATGRTRWTDTTKVPLHDSNGQVIGIVGIGHDITRSKEAERGRRFLGEASAALASSLDYPATLTRLAQLTVPTLADWCAVHILDKASFAQQVAVAHVDPDKSAWAAELNRQYPPAPGTTSGVWRVLSTGQAELYSDITDAMLVATARDARHLEMTRAVGFSSLMIVPLIARGQTLGALQFVAAESGRHYDASDLAFAQDLADRAAIAVDNARLYQEAREQREHLQITLSSIGDAVIATDAEGRVSFMNPVAQSLTGWTQAEAQGQALREVFQIVDEASREPIENPVARVMRGGTAVGLANHTILIARNGTEVHIDDTGAPIRDENGAIVGIILVFHNITEQRRAQIALRDSEQRFKAIFDQAAVGLTQATFDGRWLLANQRFCDMLGYSRDELLNRTYMEFTHPDDLPTQLEHARRVRTGEAQTYSMEKRYLRKDGSPVWTNVTSSLVRSVTDNLDTQVSIVEDISERKRTEQALVEERNLLRTLIDNLPDYIFTKDTDGRFMVSNAAHAHAVQLEPPALVGRTAVELFGPELAPVYEADDRLVLHTGQALINVERTTTDAAGSRRAVLTTKVPLRDQVGQIVGLVGISRDVTERKRLEVAEHEQRIIAETLANVTLALTSQLSLEGVLDEILRQAQRLIPSSASHIALLENDLVRPVRWQGYGKFGSDNFVARQAQTLADSPLDAEAIQLRRLVIVPDTKVDPRWVTFEETGWIRSSIGTPVCLRDQVLGVLWLDSDAPNRFAAEDAARLQPLTAAAAIALENARLFGQAQREIAERNRAEQAEREQRVLAEALLDTSVALTSTLDPAVVMNRVLENIGRVISHDSANIMLVDGDAAHIAYWHGYPADLARFLKTQRFPLDIAGLRQMIETRLPILVNDVTVFPGWISHPETTWVRSYAAAPIQTHGQVIGFLNIDSAEPQHFSTVNAKALQAFANQTAIALENAQLYDELRRHAADLERRVELRTAELYKAMEHLETIFTSSTDAIVVVGRDSLIEQKNPAFRSLFGYQPGEALGRPIVALAAPGSVDALTDSLNDVVAEAVPRQIELVAKRKDGTRFDADLVLSPIVGPGRQTTEVICSLRNITQRKQMEIGLWQTLEKERELVELRSRFVSMASHDFRTPLAVILSSAGLLKLYNDKLAAAARLKHLDRIHVGVKQMTDLLDDVLTFSQGEEGRLEFKPVRLDLAGLCREMLEETQIASGDTHEFVYSSRDSCSDVFVDRKLLRQIVSNLLSNAAKYSQEGSQVHFDLLCEPGRAVLRVQDHGLGIPEKDQARLFEPFHRAGNVSAMRGTGLGLAIVKKAVELHGGTIGFESQVGVGTTFTVVIPTSQKAQL